MSDFGMTDHQIEFVNGIADRIDDMETAMEGLAHLSDQLESVGELAKNFAESRDYGSEIEGIKNVLGRVVETLGIDLSVDPEASGAVAAEGDVEKGDKVVERGEDGEARKKEGMNFAAELAHISKRLDQMEQNTVGRTSSEASGETLEKRATDSPLFFGKF